MRELSDLRIPWSFSSALSRPKSDEMAERIRAHYEEAPPPEMLGLTTAGLREVDG